MSELALPAIGGEFMGGTLLGGVVGWGAKKMFNIIKILAGVFVAIQTAILGWLNHHGVITVHPDAFWTTSTNLASSEAASGAMDVFGAIFTMMMNVLPAGSGMMVGAAVGWRRG